MAISYSENMLNHLLLCERLEESITVSRGQGFRKKLACELDLSLISLVAAIETVAYALLTAPSCLIACCERRPFDRYLGLSKSSATTLSIAIPYLFYNLTEEIDPRLTSPYYLTEEIDLRLTSPYYLTEEIDPRLTSPDYLLDTIIGGFLKVEYIKDGRIKGEEAMEDAINDVQQIKDAFYGFDPALTRFVAMNIAYNIVVRKQRIPFFFEKESQQALQKLKKEWKKALLHNPSDQAEQQHSQNEHRVNQEFERGYGTTPSPCKEKTLCSLLHNKESLSLLEDWMRSPKKYMEVYHRDTKTLLEEDTLTLAEKLASTCLFQELQRSPGGSGEASLQKAWRDLCI